MDHQLPPVGDWRTWVILGGRGAGKTRAGAEWVRSLVEGATPLAPGRNRRIALVGESMDQIRAVMVFGESGIMTCSPPDRRPLWRATDKMLIWPNGATAQAFSASNPESLRGPQFDAAWLDEMAKWKKLGPTWDNLQMCLRLGQHPRQLITTTPQPLPLLRKIMDDPTTAKTHAATEANRANLAAPFLQSVRAQYKGTRYERQELDGIFLDEIDGALWSHTAFDAAPPADIAFDRVVVGVDPCVSSGKTADHCGIVVVGAQRQGDARLWRAVVLADLSLKPKTPLQWAQVVVDAYYNFNADTIVAEVNQGADLVKSLVDQVDPTVRYKAVHARKNKVARALPVATLYEQNRVFHAAGLHALQDQMCLMTTDGFKGTGSPDRVDALVWAMQHALLAQMGTGATARIRMA